MEKSAAEKTGDDFGTPFAFSASEKGRNRDTFFSFHLVT